MTTKTQARAPARALVGAAAFGSLAGLAIGCAYLGGETARESMIRTQAERFAGAAKAGYSEQSLVVAAGGLDRDALAIARRHDPSAAGSPERAPQAMLAQTAPGGPNSASAGLRTANFRAPAPASPFHMAGAMDASRDLQCLTEAVYWEARGEGDAGMAAVAQVVLNRVRHPAFPKTVCGVVYQGASEGDCQFSFACKPQTSPMEDDAWRRARQIAQRALSGHVMTAVGQATNFHAVSVTPGWMTSLQKVAQIGSHIFYRFGHVGQEHNFRYTAEPASQTPQPALASLVPSFGSAPTKPSQPIPYEMLEKAAPQAEAAAPPVQAQAQVQVQAQAQAQQPPTPAPQPAAAGARVIDAPGVNNGR